MLNRNDGLQSLLQTKGSSGKAFEELSLYDSSEPVPLNAGEVDMSESENEEECDFSDIEEGFDEVEQTRYEESERKEPSAPS